MTFLEHVFEFCIFDREHFFKLFFNIGVTVPNISKKNVNVLSYAMLNEQSAKHLDDIL